MKKWYHNNETEIQVDAEASPPEGFVPGRSPRMSAKISAARKDGRIPTWNTGIPASEERKAKQSAAMKGKTPWNAGHTKETHDSVRRTADKLKGHECFVTDWSVAKQKEYITKKLNKSFNTSKPEESMYQELIDIYGDENVVHCYSTDARYPFNCDFYIKPLDLFIELNYTWEHGPHPFDENSSADIDLLSKWQIRATELPPKNRYLWAIKVWTEIDPLKLETFRKNKMNFQIIYQNGVVITE